MINLLIAADSDPDRIENIATTPPTTLYTPKSLTPNAFSITLLVYSDITIKYNILTYSSRVFLAIRFMLSLLDICLIHLILSVDKIYSSISFLVTRISSYP